MPSSDSHTTLPRAHTYPIRLEVKTLDLTLLIGMPCHHEAFGCRGVGEAESVRFVARSTRFA